MITPALIAAVVGALIIAGVAVVPARAALPATEQKTAAMVTADALPTVQTNGVVWATASKGNVVYAAGNFTKARPAGSPAGENEVDRNRLLAFDVTTGNLITSFTAGLDGSVYAMTLSPDKSRLYVAGQFFNVIPSPGATPVSRARIAAFDTATGALITAFAPPYLNNRVNAIAATASTVYVGGQFTNESRGRLAAFRASDGAKTAWGPKTDNAVRSMTMSPDQQSVIVGGSFKQVYPSGSSTPSTILGITSINASTGAIKPYPINQTVKNGYTSSAGIWSLRTSGDTVYGTAFSTKKDGNFEGAFAVNGNSGTIKWLADCHGDSYDAAVLGGAVYVASHWHICKNIGGFQDSSPAFDSTRSYHRVGAVTVAAKGTVAKNTEGDPGDFQGNPAPAVVNWFPDMAVPVGGGETNQAAWSTTAAGSYLVVGGEFPAVNGTAQEGLVRFGTKAAVSGGPKMGPMASAADSKPVVRSSGTTAARVTWPTSWDRDDMMLTYKLYRSDRSAPLTTISKGSFFWSRPWLGYDDTAVTNGGSYTYSVVASDADGNTVTSASTSVTIGSAPLSDNAYSNAVKADAPSSYWRLNDAVGSTWGGDWLTKYPLKMRSGVTFGAPGAIGGSDTAATFSGTPVGAGATGSLVTGPNTFTVELWFKTTSTQGGRLIGFGDFGPINAQGGGIVQSGHFDRMVYMGDNGKLNFGVKPSVARVIESPNAYNDGQWHHLAATLSGSGANQGMVLYVDGQEVKRSTANTTTAESYSGFWRIGGDNLTSWWHQPTSFNFAGSLDEVAVWNGTALSASRIAAHYAARNG